MHAWEKRFCHYFYNIARSNFGDRCKFSCSNEPGLYDTTRVTCEVFCLLARFCQGEFFVFLWGNSKTEILSHWLQLIIPFFQTRKSRTRSVNRLRTALCWQLLIACTLWWTVIVFLSWIKGRSVKQSVFFLLWSLPIFGLSLECGAGVKRILLVFLVLSALTFYFLDFLCC